MTTRQQQAVYLQAMGIQAWETRDAQASEAVVDEVVVDEVQVAEVQVSEKPVDEKQVAEMPLVNVVDSGTLSSVSDDEPPMPTDDFMASLDMSEVVQDLPPVTAPAINVSTLDWSELQSLVSACTACELHQSRTQALFGEGSQTADWMIIGEAPKVDEDELGKPFVGAPGDLLNNMLRALGLKREQVFVSNILKCRPADDRDPHPEEIVQCEAYLQRQIALIAPKVILAMGGVAAHGLLKVKTPVTKLRGQVHHYGETPVVVTYHPSYLLRKPSEKAKSWTDLRFATSIVKGNHVALGEQP